MTDIVGQAARVLYEHYRRSDGLDVTAQKSAQALADAGLLAQPARTVPNRAAIAQALYNNHRDHINDNQTALDLAEKGTDAALELLAGKPTVNEVKARALEEAADDLEADLGTTGPGNRRTGYGAVALDLLRLIRNRAQQIRDGE